MSATSAEVQPGCLCDFACAPGEFDPRCEHPKHRTANPINAIPGLTAKDRADLNSQLEAVEGYLLAGWHTVAGLAMLVKGSPQGVSARIRDLRKAPRRWNVVSKKVRESRVHLYRIEGRLPSEPAKKKPRDSELDALRAELAELRKSLESLRAKVEGGQ